MLSGLLCGVCSQLLTSVRRIPRPAASAASRWLGAASRRPDHPCRQTIQSAAAADCRPGHGIRRRCRSRHLRSRLSACRQDAPRCAGPDRPLGRRQGNAGAAMGGRRGSLRRCAGRTAAVCFAPRKTKPGGIAAPGLCGPALRASHASAKSYPRGKGRRAESKLVQVLRHQPKRLEYGRLSELPLIRFARAFES